LFPVKPDDAGERLMEVAEWKGSVHRMTFSRPGSLRALVLCFLAFRVTSLHAQQPEPANPPAPNPPQTTPNQPAPPKPANPFENVPQAPAPAAPKPANPFENVPQAPGPEAPKPEAPKTEAPKPAAPGAQPAAPPENIIEDIIFRGARRVPQDVLRLQIMSKKGDPFDEDQLDHDYVALWNTNRFNDITMEKEPGQTGWVVTFVLVERPVVRTFDFDGLKSIQKSEILDRFKERKVGLSADSNYDPNKVQHATVVLQEYLAERGRQFATVEPQLHQVPPSGVSIIFKVDEGPKVKVNEINFMGNKVYSHLILLRSMRNLHPYGIPYSIYFESLFNKVYDSTKLEEDQDMLELFYRDEGYYTAHVTDTSVNIVDTGGGRFRFPLFWSNKPGKGADINLTIEEGHLFRVNKVNITGMNFFRTNEVILKILQMDTGDVFSTAKLRKGFEGLKSLYGVYGYIEFVVEPNIEPIPNEDKIDLTLDFEEGHQFYVRRIDFSGNTTTRDRVIRRQLLVDEGDIFNQHLWELSILHLNQLGYFEALKADTAADISKDNKNNTVDITLKVRERAKNSIQLQGGVSELSGTFVGLSYTTNNFLGLGETLGLNGQLGTMTTSATLSFTEPYLFDIPLQLGGTVFISRFNYNQAQQQSILTGQNLIPLYNQLGQQNYTTDSHGFTVFGSYPLKRAFARLGLSYGLTIQNVSTLTTAAQVYYQSLNFQNFNGPNALTGIVSSSITPSYTYNSVNSPINPSAGKSISFSTKFTGSVLGGNVNEIQPVFDTRYFRRGLFPKHVIGMHLNARFLAGYDGKTAAPFDRIYMGGEQDIRGFEIWEISPVAYIPSSASVNVLNNDGSPRQQRYVDPSSGTVSLSNVMQTIPTYQLVFPGGDLGVYGNFEYRIPIFGPVTLALFLDAGVNRLVDTNQLQLNPATISSLNSQFPEAGFKNNALVAAGTQALRSSTGLELQVLMPVVNAPFRVYFAVNPNVVRENLIPPIAADRSYFPNEATYENAIYQYGQALPFFERRDLFRFTVGRTF
jgi:outer membrane protein insertion porin family